MAGENDLSGKVGLDYADFQRGIAALNQQLKNIEVSFRGSASTMDDWSSTSEGLGLRISTLNEKLTLQKTKLKALTDEFNLLNNSEGDHAKEQQQLAGQMATLEKQIGATQGEIKKYSTALGDLEGNADGAGTEVEKAGKKAKQSGEDAKSGESGWGKLGDGLKSVGKVAGEAVLALGAAATGTAAAVAGMTVSAARDAAAYSDDVSTIATQTGLTTDQIQQLKYQSDLVDVSLETVTGSMSKLTKNMATAQGGTGSAAEAFKALGISVTDSNGELRNNQDVFNDAIDALGKMDNETQRDAYSMQLFGKSAQDLNPLIEAGGEKLNQLANDASAAGYILGGDALNSLNAYQDSMDKLSKQKDALKNALGISAAPALTVFTDNLDLAANALTQLLSGSMDADDFSEQIGQAIDNVVQYINTSLPGLINAGMGILNAVVDGISQALPSLLAAASPIITTIVSGISSALPSILSAAATILTALLQGIIDALPTLIPAAVALLAQIGQAIIDNLPLLVASALQIILQLATSLTDSLPELIPTIVDVVIQIVNTLIDNIDLLIDASIAIIIALAEGLINAMPRLIEKAPEIVQKLVAAIITNAPKLASAAAKLMVVLAKGLADGVVQMVSAGGNLVSGLFKGMSNSLAWLKEKIRGWVGDVLTFIKKLFGIASPSKVMSGIGGYLSEGLANGITDKANLVDDAMSRLSGQITGSQTFNANLNGHGSSGGYGFATTNLYLDSKQVVSATSPVQYSATNTKARSYGVVLA